ncbi:MAG: hypothetical protein WB952_16695 [Terriglobales bacterium]
MTSPQVQRDGCSFKAVQTADGKTILRLELFHGTIPLLAGATIDFELLSGTTLAQARSVADAVNERILSLVVTKA